MVVRKVEKMIKQNNNTIEIDILGSIEFDLTEAIKKELNKKRN